MVAVTSLSKLYVTYKLRGKYGRKVDEGLENCRDQETIPYRLYISILLTLLHEFDSRQILYFLLLPFLHRNIQPIRYSFLIKIPFMQFSRPSSTSLPYLPLNLQVTYSLLNEVTANIYHSPYILNKSQNIVVLLSFILSYNFNFT